MTDALKYPVPSEAEFYLSVFQCFPFPTVVLKPDMLIWEVNTSFLKRFGIDREDAVGKPCYEVFHGRTTPCPESYCNFRQAFNSGLECCILHESKDRLGKPMMEEVRLTPLLDKKGHVWGVLESLSDVTEAKRLHDIQVETNEFLNRLLDSLVGVVVAADLKGKILFVNRSVERVLGFKVEELVGKPLWKISTDEELKKVRKTMQANQGRALMIRTKVRTKSGEEIPGRINSALVYREGKPVATVGIFTDLREQMKMEDEVAQARMQVLQSDKLAGLGRMAAGIAHELNNPLTGITIIAELLKESLDPESPAQDDLSGILEDAERCREIVKGLLDYSRQSDLKVKNVDLSQVVEDAFNLIRDDSIFLNVEVIRHYAREPLLIQGDPKLLRQVFINLLMNAVDAMEGHGRLTVTTVMGPDGWRHAEISDTGPGISIDYVNKIFDPFFTTKSVGKGTGLGLSVVFGVLERHGGMISVKETGPQGTTFLVRLPPEAPDEFLALIREMEPVIMEDEEIS